MSQTSAAFDHDEPAMAVAPEELAARLAGKLCHDFISPASAIVSGLDLLDDPTAKDMREEAMELIASSARKLTDLLAFARTAFAASSGGDDMDTGEIGRLLQGVYAHARAELDWAIEPQAAPKRAGLVLINLAHLAIGALPLGGKAHAQLTHADGAYAISIRAEGPKARLHAEVNAGLEGGPLGEGLSGRWVQAYYVAVIARAGGGTVTAEAGEELVTFQARIPA